jgi:hypothetical protein
MPGKTLKQKIISFNEAQGITIDGVQMGKEVRLPHSQSTRNKILERVDEAVTTPARLTTQAELKGGLASLLKKKQERAEPRPEPEVTHKVEVKHTFTFKHVHESAPPPPPPTRREPVDGGDLTPERKTEAEIQPEALPTPTAPQLPPPPVAVSQPWAAHAWVQMRDRASEPRLLTYQPAEKPKNPWARKLA